MYEITGQPNLKWNKEKVLTSQRINDCMTDIHDHWYSPCVSMSMNHNVWCAFVFVFSKPQPCNRTRVEGHTSQAHLQDGRRPPFVCELLTLCELSCMQQACMPLIVSPCHITLLRNIFCGQDPSASLCLRVYKIVCFIAFGRWTQKVW